MIFRAIFCGALLSVMWLSAPSILMAQESPVDYVDPFIGTGGHGHTFPGATVPFGMVGRMFGVSLLGFHSVWLQPYASERDGCV
jgi:hypothetical protein